MNNINANFCFGFNWSEVKLKAGSRKTIKGYIATDKIDIAGDKFLETALDDIYRQIKEKIDTGYFVTADIDHYDWVDENGKVLRSPQGKFPIGKVVDVWRETGKIGIEVEITELHPSAKNIWEAIKEGLLHSFSIAGYMTSGATNLINGKKVNEIWKYIITQITLTGAPINPEANFVPVIKSAILNVQEKTKGETMLKCSKKAMNWLKNKAGDKLDDMTDEDKKKELEAYDGDNEAELKAEMEEDETAEKKKKEDEEKEKKDEADNKAKMKAQIDALEKSNEVILKSFNTYKTENELKLKAQVDNLTAKHTEYEAKLKAVVDELKVLKDSPILKARNEALASSSKTTELNIQGINFIDFVPSINKN